MGFETLQERDGHVRTHNRPSKCPEQYCFYGEVGFASERILKQHIALCHSDPISNSFVFPKLRKSPPPIEDEGSRFRNAIIREDLDILRDMIHTNGTLKGQYSRHAYTGLEYAASFGKLKSVRCLLECGCNIRAVSGHGPALHTACRAGRTDVVQFLLSHSTSKDVDRKDKGGRTPLSWAARTGDGRALKLLLGHGVEVDVNAKDIMGRTPLSWAASREDSESVPAVKILLEQDRVDVDAHDNRGRTPLSWAAREGYPGLAELFLEHDVAVDVNAMDDQDTALLGCIEELGIGARGQEVPGAGQDTTIMGCKRGCSESGQAVPGARVGGRCECKGR